MPDPTTDPVIPPAAIEATTEARYAHRDASGPYGHVKCSCGASFVTGVEQLQHASQSILLAALPHLRPLVEPQELRLATEVALKLGRQEAAELIAKAFEAGLSIEGVPTFSRESDRLTASRMVRGYARKIRLSSARDTGKGDSA